MSYNLEWRDTATLTTTVVTGITDPFYDLTGLTASTGYEFRVQETDGTTNSAWSAWSAFATTSVATTWPQSPSWRDQFNRTTEFGAPYEVPLAIPEIVSGQIVYESVDRADPTRALRILPADVGVLADSTLWGIAADLFSTGPDGSTRAQVVLRTLDNAELAIVSMLPTGIYVQISVTAGYEEYFEAAVTDSTTPIRIELLTNGTTTEVRRDGVVIKTFAKGLSVEQFELALLDANPGSILGADNLYVWSDSMSQTGIVNYSPSAVEFALAETVILPLSTSLKKAGHSSVSEAASIIDSANTSKEGHLSAPTTVSIVDNVNALKEGSSSASENISVVDDAGALKIGHSNTSDATTVGDSASYKKIGEFAVSAATSLSVLANLSDNITFEFAVQESPNLASSSSLKKLGNLSVEELSILDALSSMSKLGSLQLSEDSTFALDVLFNKIATLSVPEGAILAVQASLNDVQLFEFAVVEALNASADSSYNKLSLYAISESLVANEASGNEKIGHSSVRESSAVTTNSEFIKIGSYTIGEAIQVTVDVFVKTDLERPKIVLPLSNIISQSSSPAAVLSVETFEVIGL